MNNDMIGIATKTVEKELDCYTDHIEELEAQLLEAKIRSNTYAHRLVLLGEDDVVWYVAPLPCATKSR